MLDWSCRILRVGAIRTGTPIIKWNAVRVDHDIHVDVDVIRLRGVSTRRR